MAIAGVLNQAETRWFSFITAVSKLAYHKPSFPVINYEHFLSKGLQLCVPIYEQFGNKLNDILYGRTGTFNGNLAYITNRLGVGLTFDGTGDYAEFANSPELNITGNRLTIACGIRFSTSQTNKVLVAKWGATTAFALIIDNTTANKINFTVNTGASAGIVSTGTYNDNEIHNIVATYDGSNINLYIDGISVATPVAKTGNLTSTTEVLRLGMYSSSTGDYTGELNYCYIWDRALSQLEAQLLHFDPYIFLRPQVWWMNTTVQIAKFRKTLSSLGTGVGKRQCHS